MDVRRRHPALYDTTSKVEAMMGAQQALGVALPNFVICGAQKSGSTALYHYLRTHPEVHMPETKEPNFFNFHYDRGMEYYQNFFSGWDGEPAVGEASIRYMIDPNVPARMAEHLPNAKLLFVLRNPIERAWSHYWFRIGKREDEGLPYTGPTFSDVIRDPDDPVSTIEWGMYHKHLARFEEHFGRENMMIFLHEELLAHPQTTLSRAFKFIGVDPTFRPPAGKRHNVTEYPRNLELYRVFRTIYRTVGRGMRALKIDVLLEPMHSLRVAARSRLLEHKGRPPAMKIEDREYLRRVYSEPTKRLGEYLGRDLGHWR